MKKLVFWIVLLGVLCVANVVLAATCGGTLNSIAGAVCGVALGLNLGDLINKIY